MNELIHNDILVENLGQVISQGGAALRDVPDLLKVILKEQAWQERVIRQTGEVAAFERFSDFVETEPLQGLGADLKMLHRMCEGNSEVKSLLIAAESGDTVPLLPPGRPGPETKETLRGNVSGRGNRSEYLAARIARDAPEVLERMKAGEFKSIYAAAQEAGIRPKPSAEKDLQRAWKRATEEERQRFREWILG